MTGLVCDVKKSKDVDKALIDLLTQISFLDELFFFNFGSMEKNLLCCDMLFKGSAVVPMDRCARHGMMCPAFIHVYTD